jgi:hypothetical protein
MKRCYKVKEPLFGTSVGELCWHEPGSNTYEFVSMTVVTKDDDAGTKEAEECLEAYPTKSDGYAKGYAEGYEAGQRALPPCNVAPFTGYPWYNPPSTWTCS